jgi:alpha-tubulin suppressor-like RCC1 family protein
MASGNMHHVVGADDSCISWGVAQNGELGYGPNGQKYVYIKILEYVHYTVLCCCLFVHYTVLNRLSHWPLFYHIFVI